MTPCFGTFSTVPAPRGRQQGCFHRSDRREIGGQREAVHSLNELAGRFDAGDRLSRVITAMAGIPRDTPGPELGAKPHPVSPAT